MTCLCGDAECASCGRAQGTYSSPRYHLERDSTAIYLWRTGGPCVAILPAGEDRQEAERLATRLLKAANGGEVPQ
mgnify:CR=1 FL=1